MTFFNSDSTRTPPLPKAWMVRLTATEDQIVVKPLGVDNMVETRLGSESLARTLVEKINNIANRLRNPSRSRLNA